MKIWNEVEMEGEGLLARAFCHEIDHLGMGNSMLCRTCVEGLDISDNVDIEEE